LAALDAREMAGLQLQGQRRQNDFLGAQQAEQLAGVERANQDRDLFQRAVQSSGGDQNALIRALEGSGSQGLMKVSQEMRKTLEEAANKASSTAKNNADADKERLAMTKTRGEMVLQAVSAAKDQASYQQALQWLGSQGMDVSTLPQQYDPAFVENSGRQAMTIVQRADQEWKAKGYQLDVDKFGEVKRSNVAGETESQRANRAREGLTARGQNMTDARSRDANNLTKEAARTQLIETADGVMLVDKGTGMARPATADGKPLPGKDKPLTEGQAKAVAFAARMASANSTLAELEKAGRTVSTPGSRTGFGVGNVVNVVNTAAGQQLDQAKRDFVNAVLRRESGAVISDSEFSNADKQYFPQIGDSKEVIRQKERNRTVALEGMKADIPKAYMGEFERVSSIGRKSSGPAGKSPSVSNW